MDDGLEQPVANWVKLCVSLGGGGKKVHPVALTPGSRVHSRETRLATAATPTPGSHHTLPKGPGAIALGTYTTRAPPGLEISKLATTRFPISKLATARILCFSHPPPLGLILRPHCHRDISVATIPSDKGSDIAPTPPPVDSCRKWTRRKELLGWCLLVLLCSCPLWASSLISLFH